MVGDPAALFAPPEAPLVLLDGDLLAFTRGFPLALTAEAKRHLDTALRRDVAWLASNAVVDYSLLIGVEPTAGVLSVGMIDYVRRFDIVKRLENRVKSVTSLAEPTVVQPERYAERLLTAANKYLAGVPSRWAF
jgi:1-phosphatidylinositol-3-phosphate 5-kinase